MQLKYVVSLGLLVSMLTACGGSGSGNDSDGLSLADETTDIGSTDTGIADTGITIAEPDAVTDETSTANTDPGTVDDDAGTADTGIAIADTGTASNDSGTTTDTGTVSNDSGTTNTDTGTASNDSGTTNTDSGTTNTDTGTANNDSGTTNPDTGTASNDSGTTNTDTGTVSNDNGTTNTDTGTVSNDNDTTTTDTSTVSNDSGTTNTDTGTASSDNGTANTDTDTANNDSGTTDTDAGTTSNDTDTSSADAGADNTADSDVAITDDSANTDVDTINIVTDADTSDAGADSSDAGTDNSDAGADNSNAGADNSDAGADNSVVATDISDSDTTNTDTGTAATDTDADTGIMSDDSVTDTSSGGSNVIVCCLQEDRTPPAPGSVFTSATAPVVFNRLADVSDVGPQSISLGNNSSFPGLRYGNLLMLNNAFNAGNTRWDGWSQSISLNDGAPVTADVVWDWGLESQKNQIFATTSFPELIYGTKSAAERSGTFAETGLPVEEADRPDISINYSYSRTEGVTQAPLGPNDTGAEAADSEHNVIIESFWHESCDIVRNGSPQDNVVMEMLIWYYHGERLPSGPADLFESGVLIDGQMWTVYVNSNNFNYLAYVAEDVETAERQSGTLNYSAFIEHMLANDERYGVYEVVPTDCFANISFGPEVFQGAGTFTWNDFTVTRQY